MRQGPPLSEGAPSYLPGECSPGECSPGGVRSLLRQEQHFPDLGHCFQQAELLLQLCSAPTKSPDLSSVKLGGPRLFFQREHVGSGLDARETPCCRLLFWGQACQAWASRASPQGSLSSCDDTRGSFHSSCSRHTTRPSFTSGRCSSASLSPGSVLASHF